MQELSPAFKDTYKIDAGVLVREVLPGEASEKAGRRI